MTNDNALRLTLRSQRLGQDEGGHNEWQVMTTEVALDPAQTARRLCDVWDKHWSRGATERVNQMVPRMNEVVVALRTRGVQIIHAPSDTMAFYAGTPARQRMIDAPPVEPPPPLEHADPPLPVDACDWRGSAGPIRSSG